MIEINNKKAGLIKFVLFIAILIVLFIMLNKLANAQAINIVNITVSLTNSSDLILGVGGVNYYFNDSIFNFSLQHNFTVSFDNITANITNNITTTIIVNNGTINVTCNCPVPSCSPTYNVSCSGEIDLRNETKEQLINGYTSLFSTKIEESGNKIAQDIIFKLQPAQVEIENCRSSAFNASLLKTEAERQRDAQAANNLAITGIYEGCRSEKRWLEVIGLAMVLMFVLFLVNVYGQDFLDGMRNLRGGGAM